MSHEVEDLKGLKIGVIGFNARPIACSAKKAGAEVYVSDFWGDDDLSNCADDWVAVLTPEPNRRQRGSREDPVHTSLTSNFIERFSDTDFDFILIGSAFDDHSKSLTDVASRWKIAGNSIDLIKRARDHTPLRKYCKEFEIAIPQYIDVDILDDALSIAEHIGYPIIARRVVSGGGTGIRFARNSAELEYWFNLKIPPVRMQEYVSGIDVSCSVLSNGSSAQALSVQGQLIGLPTAGRNCDFVYCGNYMPVRLDDSTLQKIITFSETVCQGLGLVGSNGIDLVLDSEGQLWFMEVNPRIQGSLEMLELAADISITQMHLDAIHGKLPKTSPEYNAAVKLVVYSRQAGYVSDLSLLETTVDRTPEGGIVDKGDPICSILEVGESLSDCYSRVMTTARQIQREMKKVE
ncbi:MAG: ATP-grasp domain-containing protein [Candidatus Thorarchaeota archaeon]